MSRLTSFFGFVSLSVAVSAVVATGGCAKDGGSSAPSPVGAADAATPSADAGSGECTAPKVRCGSQCVDPRNDNANCGSCGATCGEAQPYCVGGVCMVVCPVGMLACGATCADLANDPEHCGHCGSRCDDGLSCFRGTCQCPPYTIRCGKACINPKVDGNNCGACGVACSGGLVCSDGKCNQCGANETVCAIDSPPISHCVDTRKSPLDCGGCGITCPAGLVCTDGTCGCGTLLQACGDAGACVNVRFDANNCGACGHTCNSGTCVDGSCK